MGMRQFTEPDINLFFDDLNQAALLNNKASFIGKGYMKITVGDIRGNTIPNILQGSQLEANGVLWVADTTQTVPTTGLANGVNYLYILEDGAFGFSTSPPEWRSVKGGWYLNNYRAILKFDRKTTDGNYTYSNKVVLDSFKAMYETPQYSAEPYDFTQTDPQGTLVYSKTTAGDDTVTLEPGAYQIHLVSGGGSGGARGMDDNSTEPSSGSPGASGKSGGSVNGFPGANGIAGTGGSYSGTGGNGGDGGSGAYIVFYFQIEHSTKYKLIIGGNSLFANGALVKYARSNDTASPYDGTATGPGAGGKGATYRDAATAGKDGAVFIYKL
jgi:hypothetical protein